MERRRTKRMSDEVKKTAQETEIKEELPRVDLTEEELEAVTGGSHRKFPGDEIALPQVL
jgi:hypothetical protein